MPYGMTDQEYANEIKRKEAAGATLANPNAAAQFKQVNQNLFAPKPQTQATPQQHDYRTDYMGNLLKDERMVDFSKPHTLPALMSDPRASGALGQRQSVMDLFSADRRLQQEQQVQDMLQQLISQANQPFKYDPGSDPAYQAILPQVQQDVMEQLNARGILNSSMTGENLARMTAGIIPELVNQAYARRQGQMQNLDTVLDAVMGLEKQQYDRARQIEADRMAQQAAALEAEQQKLDNAWKRVKEMGVVDNYASIILGIPPNTPSLEAQKAYDDRASRLQIAREQIAGSMARTQYTQGQVNQRQRENQGREDESKRATQLAVAQALDYDSPDEAYAALRQYGADMAESGVDIYRVLQAIKNRWPASSGGLTEEEIEAIL